MKPLEHPNSFYLLAAEGWLELGDHLEANEELERISAELRGHPDVLQVRWRVFAAARKWEAAAEIAQGICRLAPDEQFGWIHLSYSLHEMKRTKEALDTLLHVAHKFPNNWLVAYNLACYQTQLGELEEAWRWLDYAMDKADPKEIRLKALDDPDLEPLWQRIGELRDL
jgi:tetratricopeptide (TPR) repeat protein